MNSVASLARLVGGEVVGDGSRLVERLAPLDEAGPRDISFLAHPRYRRAAAESRAGALIVAPEVVPTLAGGPTLLVVADPYLAMARIAARLHTSETARIGVRIGIHPGAHVDPEARVEPAARIEAGAVVEAGARIAAGAFIGATAFVGQEATVGPGSILHPGAKLLARCSIGARVILQAGAVVGADGFGYAVDGEGVRHKIPQLGTVVLEDDVEVGANACIDRATFGETRIGRGTKLDNLVQIAHNVRTGEHCVIVSQSGVAGSTTLGDRVIMGAQTGAVGHIRVADDVVVGARGALGSDVETPGVYSGAPAIPHRRWLKATLLTHQLPALRRRIARLEALLAGARGVDDGDAGADGEGRD